jgi:para-nitrobenzyl esterase
VFVYIYGGANVEGSASVPAYDGEGLASKGLVVVTFNYRVGLLGFFSHPELSKEAPYHASGNYGLLDQIAALHWVKANARAFGGSPDRVTVFGQAAGAVSITCLMTSPLARGLFHAAILESGSALSIPRVGVTRYLKDPPPGEESMEDVGELVARRLGCDHEDDVLAALRAKTTEEVLAASRPAPNFFGEGLRFGPVVDRFVLPDRPSAIFEQRRQLRIPVIVGANADEGSFFAGSVQPADMDGYRRFVRSTFRERADEVLARFPVYHDSDVRPALSRLIGVAGFLAPARRTARLMADLGPRTYLYWFTRQRPGGRPAGHGAELPFVFNLLGRVRGEVDDADRELSLLMIGYWVRFARNGDPNGDNAPTWPRYRASSDQSLELGDQPQPRSGVYHDVCDFFDRMAGSRLRKK